jgi:hypothetical protein
MGTPDWLTSLSISAAMKVTRPAYADCLYVCRHLRTQDRAEVLATHWSDDPVDLAHPIAFSREPLSWCLHGADDEPICLLGANQLWPNFWAPWAMATPRFAEIGKAATRFVKRTMIPAMVDLGFQRAECRTLGSNTVAAQWLERLGAIRESENPRVGRHGETFHTYVFYPENCHEVRTRR